MSTDVTNKNILFQKKNRYLVLCVECQQHQAYNVNTLIQYDDYCLTETSVCALYTPFFTHNLKKLFIYCTNINSTHLPEQFSLYLTKIGPVLEEQQPFKVYMPQHNCQTSEHSFAWSSNLFPAYILSKFRAFVHLNIPGLSQNIV